MANFKSVTFVLGVAILLVSWMDVCKAMDEAEGKEMLKGMAADCKEKEGASDEDVDLMVNKGIPTNKPGKCLNACMMDQFGVMADGKFQPDGLVEVAKLATENDEEMVKNAEEIANECKTVVDDDRCELAVKIMQCMQEGAEKRGLKQ